MENNDYKTDLEKFVEARDELIKAVYIEFRKILIPILDFIERLGQKFVKNK